MFTELRETLEGLLNIRLQKNQWDDSENEPGLLRTLEALTCFGSPAYYYETLKIFDRRFEIIKIPEEILVSDLKYILEIYERKGFPPSPYLDSEFAKLGIDYEKGKTDFTDTVSFFSTTMLDLMEYFEVVYKKEIPEYQKVQQALKDAIDWLINNAIQINDSVYWTWGAKNIAENIPSVYFTWSATVALSYISQSKYSPLSENDKRRIISLLQGVAKWISVIIEEDPNFPNQRWRINYQRFDDTEAGRKEALLIYIMSINDWLSQIGIMIDPKILKSVLNTVLDIWRSGQMFRFEGGDHLIILPPSATRLKKSVMLEYEDRSYEYLLLSVLCWFYMAHKENKFPLSQNDFNDLDIFIDELRKKLLADRDPITKLWKKDSFLLYLTQRALEAIMTYMRYVYPYKGMEISLYDAIKIAVESVFEEYKPIIVEKIYKNIEILRKGFKEE